MTNQVIPDAALEAALREWAIRGGLSPEGIVRNILEAAAPHLMEPRQTAISSVLALHREVECRDEDGEPTGGSCCEECKDLDDHSGERVHEVYPCLTVREITAALAGKETYTAMRDRIEAQVI